MVAPLIHSITTTLTPLDFTTYMQSSQGMRKLIGLERIVALRKEPRDGTKKIQKIHLRLCSKGISNLQRSFKDEPEKYSNLKTTIDSGPQN